MRILLAEDEVEIAEMIAFLLESRFGATVVQVKSGNEAVALLKKDPAFDCVICDFVMRDGFGSVVYQYLKTHAPQIPFVLCSGGSPEGYTGIDLTQIDGLIEKPFILDPLVALLKMLISTGRIRTEQTQITYSAYCRIPIRLVRRITTFPCDLFVKLTDEKYVRVFGASDSVSGNDLTRFQEKTLEYLYLKRQDLPEFLKVLEQQLLGVVRQGELGFEGGAAVSIETLELIADLTRQIGMTPEVRALTKTAVEQTVNLLRTTPGIREVIARLMNSGDSFLISHSVVLAFTACAVADRLGIADIGTCKSLTLAAFLHDITLHTQELAQSHSLNELKSSADVAHYSYSDLESFRKHPEAGSKLAQVVEGFPQIASVIILEHHEAPDGTGFPKGKQASQLGLLSSLFIVAEDLLLTLSEGQPMISVRSFAAARKAKYSNGNFGTVLAGLVDAPS